MYSLGPFILLEVGYQTVTHIGPAKFVNSNSMNPAFGFPYAAEDKQSTDSDSAAMMVFML